MVPLPTLPCLLEELDKASRDIFVEGDFADVQENFQELMTYCANDTLATLEVFAKVSRIAELGFT